MKILSFFQENNIKRALKFGSFGKSSYLCSVRTLVLAIRVESRERQDLVDTASEQDITDTTPF